MRITKAFYSGIAAVALLIPQAAKSDMFGGDIPILLEILSNNISQLYQLYELVNQAQQNIALMKEINSGVSDALKTVELIKKHPDAGLYGDWNSVEQALRGLQDIYGKVPKSANALMQGNTDKTVAEAINMNTKMFAYADQLNKVGSEIEGQSRGASPKGAARLTAQSLGVMIQAMNESLRGQAAGLKLQAQDLATKNSREKDETRSFVSSTSQLSSSLRNHHSQFTTPRF